MTRKYTSLSSDKVAINRELDTTSYDTVKLVADNLPAILTASKVIDDNINYSKEWATNPFNVLVSTEAGGNGIDEYSSLHNSQLALNNIATKNEAETGTDTDKFISPLRNNDHFNARLGNGYTSSGTMADLGTIDLDEVNINLEGAVYSSAISNAPTNFSGLGLLSSKALISVAGTGSGYVVQSLTSSSIDNPQKWIRHKNNGVFTIWKEVINIESVIADDYTELALLLANDDIPVGSILTVLSPNGYTYEKKQGTATDNGSRVITQNRGTTTTSQYYGELTGAYADLPSYSLSGNYFNDTGTQEDEFILTLRDGQLPLDISDFKDGMQFNFVANNNSSGFDFPTVDVSDIFGQTTGSLIVSIAQYPNIVAVGENQIEANQPVELIYNSSHLILKNSATYSRYDNYNSFLTAKNTNDAIDEVNDKINSIANDSLNIVGHSHNLVVGATYLITAYTMIPNRGTGTITFKGFRLLDELDNVLYSEADEVINSPDGSFPVSRTVLYTATGTGFIKAQADHEDASNLTIIKLLS